MDNSLLGLAYEIEGWFFLIGALILLIEIAKGWFSKSFTGKTALEMIASASTQIPYILVEIFLLAGAYTALYWFSYETVTWGMPVNAWTIVAALIACDLTYYWEHRVAHVVRLLWTQHAVHHSSRDYNIVTSIRFGPLESLWSFAAHFPLILIGFPPDAVIFGIITVLAYQTWLHTETIGKLGPLEWILNTPSHHRVHHGSDEKYLDKNYGGILIIWDRIFGSFQVEEETPRYGLKRDFDSKNPIMVWFSEWPGLIRDCVSARSGSELFKRLFAHPGWKPPERQINVDP